MKLGTFHGAALMLAGTFIAAAALAHPAPRPGKRPTASTPATARAPAPAAAPAAAQPPANAAPGAAQAGATLRLPSNPIFLGDTQTSVRKATAIVNGAVITATDVDQRLALVVLANQGRIQPDELQRLRDQVLRNLVDETLEIQAAEAADIKVEQREVDAYFARYAQSLGKTPQQLSDFLRAAGSSPNSIKRQIKGEMAWQRLQQHKIEPFVNISDEEVQSIIKRLNAEKGATEYHVSEIFLSATPETAAQARANADRIVQQLRAGGASFLAYARQFSEASTAATGGDLGWVRAEQLPEQLANAVRVQPVGSVSDPIAIPGGFSIIAVQDTRQILTADPRDATLSLKQISIVFPPNTPRPDAEAKIQQLTQAEQSMGGCGGAEAAAARIGAEVVANDIKVRDLPPSLQPTMLNLAVGQATPPFGSVNERVSVLVLCGRDDPPPVNNISYDQVYSQVAEQRVNQRAQRYLRDLRRDAVIDYR